MRACCAIGRRSPTLRTDPKIGIGSPFHLAYAALLQELIFKVINEEQRALLLRLLQQIIMKITEEG